MGDENSTDKISLIYYTVTNSLFWALLAAVKKSFFKNMYAENSCTVRLPIAHRVQTSSLLHVYSGQRGRSTVLLSMKTNGQNNNKPLSMKTNG